MDYLMPRPSLLKDISGTIYLWEDKRVHAFPKGINLEVKVKVLFYLYS